VRDAAPRLVALALAGLFVLPSCAGGKGGGTGPGNLPPHPDFSVHCAALRCDFHDASTDVDGTIVGRDWDYGDGTLPDTDQQPFHVYSTEGAYPVHLTVVDDSGAAATRTKVVTATPPVTATLQCADGSAPGGFVDCNLVLTAEAGFRVLLSSRSCIAHGTSFLLIEPVQDTLTKDGCYETPGKALEFAGPFAAGTEISAKVVAPLLANPPQLRVEGEYPEWTLRFEDGADQDFNDLVLILSALPTGG